MLEFTTQQTTEFQPSNRLRNFSIEKRNADRATADAQQFFVVACGIFAFLTIFSQFFLAISPR